MFRHPFSNLRDTRIVHFDLCSRGRSWIWTKSCRSCQKTIGGLQHFNLTKARRLSHVCVCECIRQAGDAVRTALALVYLLSPKSEAKESSTSDSDSESESSHEASKAPSSTVSAATSASVVESTNGTAAATPKLPAPSEYSKDSA